MRALASILFLLLCGCSKNERVVVVYTSQDQVYAEPVFAEFTKQTGIKVLPLFDSESVKTAGLVQRLIAEKNNPRCDVFWSNEEMLAHRLVENGIIDSNNFTRAGYRSRKLIVNTNKLAIADAPKSLADVTNAKFASRVAMAYPLYGTTAAHMVALRQLWGDSKWRAWSEALAANKPFIVDGNSLVVKLVGAGEAWIGLTDSDDLAAGLRNGLPIAAAETNDDEFLRIASSIGIIKGAPSAANARQFFDYAKSEAALSSLIQKHALEGMITPLGLQMRHPAPVDETLTILKTIFARK